MRVVRKCTVLSNRRCKLLLNSKLKIEPQHSVASSWLRVIVKIVFSWALMGDKMILMATIAKIDAHIIIRIWKYVMESCSIAHNYLCHCYRHSFTPSQIQRDLHIVSVLSPWPALNESHCNAIYRLIERSSTFQSPTLVKPWKLAWILLAALKYPTPGVTH